MLWALCECVWEKRKGRDRDGELGGEGSGGMGGGGSWEGMERGREGRERGEQGEEKENEKGKWEGKGRKIKRMGLCRVDEDEGLRWVLCTWVRVRR